MWMKDVKVFLAQKQKGCFLIIGFDRAKKCGNWAKTKAGTQAEGGTALDKLFHTNIFYV